MDGRVEAYQVLVDHQPVKRWFGWRLVCARCGVRYRCPAVVAALDELAGRAGEWWRA
ncbi:hypothetical protein ACNTMW_26545 [Planosporangium sp. 12N6]|uniref:hypothetical protein n=1 Tax=Planosporangium spinosum TaxID=3402278 RepID=UPI003CF21E9B